jgi:hypothetical protein
MNFSPSTLRIMARGISGAVLLTGLRPRLPIVTIPVRWSRTSYSRQSYNGKDDRVALGVTGQGKGRDLD